MNKTPLEIQRETFKKKIDSLNDSIRQKEDKIISLENKISEYEKLLEKDHYKDRNKKLESQKLILIHSLNEIRIKADRQALREFIDDSIQKATA